MQDRGDPGPQAPTIAVPEGLDSGLVHHILTPEIQVRHVGFRPSIGHTSENT